MKLEECVRLLVKKHGSLVKLAAATNITPGYLSKLRAGSYGKRPTAELLNKLGLVSEYNFKDPK